MKKYVLNMKVTENLRLHTNYCLLKLTTDEVLPEMLPGQFVNILVEGSSRTFLRRPISINYVDRKKNELWLLIQLIGDGTRQMAKSQVGDHLNMMLPLGNGFGIPENGLQDQKLLLIGGGVGTAPMLYLGATLKEMGFESKFLLGARSKEDLMQLDEFEKYGNVYITTEDGTLGEQGYVTDHSVLKETQFDKIFTCGPKPMMVAVARYANSQAINCEVSLENTMACGIGACLCCVEKTHKGNVCVCTEGPVFNIEKLTWLN
ncbi:MAG: dihydroorotate dehydrogenase electron transfer subunit [Tannerellaceae bacterium]|nr:dihydroorotate dehydrogenase electron transfer subunit [Tannerellaceae bacterium]